MTCFSLPSRELRQPDASAFLSLVPPSVVDAATRPSTRKAAVRPATSPSLLVRCISPPLLDPRGHPNGRAALLTVLTAGRAGRLTSPAGDCLPASARPCGDGAVDTGEMRAAV